jgi:hypothetical protein
MPKKNYGPVSNQLLIYMQIGDPIIEDFEVSNVESESTSPRYT